MFLDTPLGHLHSLASPSDRDPDPRGQRVSFHAQSHIWNQGCKSPGGPGPRLKWGRGRQVSWRHGEGPSYQHILGVVGLGGPVWDPPHATLPIAKLLAEGPILGLGVPAAVGVMEGDIEEEGPAGVVGVGPSSAVGTPPSFLPWEPQSVGGNSPLGSACSPRTEVPPLSSLPQFPHVPSCSDH